MRNDEYAKLQGSGSESGHGGASPDAEREAGGNSGRLRRERDDGAIELLKKDRIANV